MVDIKDPHVDATIDSQYIYIYIYSGQIIGTFSAGWSPQMVFFL